MSKQRSVRRVEETGLWAAVPPASHASSRGGGHDAVGPADPAPISWLPRPKLWVRIARGVSIPAAVGILAFVIALVVTASILVRGLVADADVNLAATLEEQQTSLLGGEDAALGLLNGAAGATTGSLTGASETPAVVQVHVVGEVRSPGVVELESGSRVIDAIEAAGGASEGAVLTAINLARTVADGEQIRIPDQALADSLEAADTGVASTAATGAMSGASGASGSAGDATGLVNLNTASADELTSLPRIGPSIAQRIVDWRTVNGGFTSVEQLREVSGIGAKTFEALQPLVLI